jgi:hypothetical protein
MPAHEDIRVAVEAVEHEVAELVALERATVADGTALKGLRASWDSLQLLLLPASPALSKCPHCGFAGPNDEIHCRRCRRYLGTTWAAKTGQRDADRTP